MRIGMILATLAMVILLACRDSSPTLEPTTEPIPSPLPAAPTATSTPPVVPTTRPAATLSPTHEPTSTSTAQQETNNVLKVSLASTTLSAQKIADAARANFTVLRLTAGSEDVNLRELYITREGLSSPYDLESIQVLDERRVSRGTMGAINADHRAKILFPHGLQIPGETSKELTLHAGIVDGTSSGKTVRLGIASAKDIVSSAEEVLGEFPLLGNEFTVVALTTGTVDVKEDGITFDSAPSIGDQNVVVNQFQVVAGSGEPLIVEQITALRAGSASAENTGNIELWDVTNNKSLGTNGSWAAEDKATWNNLGIRIDRGDAHRFRIQLDILGGADYAVNADIVDGANVLMLVRGETYGFYLTPRSYGWTNGNNGRGASDQTIQGIYVPSENYSNPALTIRGLSEGIDASINPGKNRQLGVFEFIAQDDDMLVTALKLSFDLSRMNCSEITSVKFVDSSGAVVAGPRDCSSSGDVSLVDAFIVPMGTWQYTVVANISGSTSPEDTLAVNINTPATMVARGLISRHTVTPSPHSKVTAGTRHIFNAYPRVSLNSTTDLGYDLIPTTETLLMVLDITSVGSDDLTFENRNGNQLTVQRTTTFVDAASERKSFVLKDSVGNVLDRVSIDVTANSIPFAFTTQGFTVPATETRQLYVYGDTTDLTEAGDAIQLWFDDNNPHAICWGINGIGNFCTAKESVKGDLFGGSFVNSS